MEVGKVKGNKLGPNGRSFPTRWVVRESLPVPVLFPVTRKLFMEIFKPWRVQ